MAHEKGFDSNGLASDGQGAVQQGRRSLWRRRWQLFRMNRLAWYALFILAAILLTSVGSPLISAALKIDPNRIDAASILSPPDRVHPLGADRMGRDILARFLAGSRVTLSVGLLIVTVSAAFGMLVGLSAGYLGGQVDNVLMRITDTMLSIPTFYLILAIVSLSRLSVLNLVLIIGFTRWMGVARLVRSETLSLKEREYIIAARCLGATPSRIVLHHVLPGVVPTLIVVASLQVGYAILLESGLSFLGVGVPPPQSSWGTMLSYAQRDIWVRPLTAIVPGAAIMTTVLCFNFIGDGLREALDPRLMYRS